MPKNFVKLDYEFIELLSETNDSARIYTTPEGEKYASITTVLAEYNKKAILEWRKRVGNEEANKVSSRAVRRGTKLHSLCEDYLYDKLNMLKLDPFSKSLFLQMKPKIDEHIDNIHCIEKPLYSHTLKIAGRVDLIAEYDGKLSVIDFKTATKNKNENSIENYFMQTCGYSEMYHERTGIQIDQGVVMIAVEGENHPQIFKVQTNKYLDQLKHYIKTYYDNNKRN